MVPLAQLEQLAHFHRALASTAETVTGTSNTASRSAAEMLRRGLGRGIGVQQGGLAAGSTVVAQVGQIDIVGRHGTILSQWQRNDGQ